MFLWQKVLRSGRVRAAVGIVPPGPRVGLWVPPLLYYTSFTRVQGSLNTPHTASVTRSSRIVREHSTDEVSAGLEHSGARTEPHVHVPRPHLLWRAPHALQ